MRGKGTAKRINNTRFKRMSEVAEDIFAVHELKKVCWDLPSGFFVYRYAKLRMLEFYYGFLLKFIKREDFQLCEMDTDSLYMFEHVNHCRDGNPQ